MDKRHQFLPIHQLCEGMVLADDLMDKLGHVLLPAGAAITDGILKSLERHDIHHVSILVDEVPGDEQERLLELQKKAERLNILFRKNPYEAPTNILQTYLQKYRTGNMS
jgi:hypothetical protein